MLKDTKKKTTKNSKKMAMVRGGRMSLDNPFIQIAIGIIFSLCFIGGIILLEQKYKVDNPQCVMTKLTQSSIIICTYKDRVLFNEEVDNE